MAAAAIGAGAAIGISRIDLDKAIRELTLPLRHEDIIRQQAAEKDLDPALIAAVIYAESRFRDQESQRRRARPDADHARDGRRHRAPERRHDFVTADLRDPQINIRYGTYYLRYLLDRYDGNEIAALAAYNAGSHATPTTGAARRSTWTAIAFPETRAYVEEVLEKREEYRDKYADELGIR